MHTTIDKYKKQVLRGYHWLLDDAKHVLNLEFHTPFIDNSYAYAWALHTVQVKWTYCHTIAMVNDVRLRDSHNACVIVKRL